MPLWFLDRTFLNASTLATTAAFRLHDAGAPSLDGRVYFWEGVYLGFGTCTHVTHYEQVFGRLFPAAARDQRRIVDYHVGWDDHLGYIRYRAELDIGHHYTRAMAGYGPFVAICGFQYHGPKGAIGFAPRLQPGNFRTAFTAAEGWGTYTQRRSGAAQKHSLKLAYGRLTIRVLRSELAEGIEVARVDVQHGNKAIPARFSQDDTRLVISLPEPLTLHAGEMLSWTARGRA